MAGHFRNASTAFESCILILKLYHSKPQSLSFFPLLLFWILLERVVSRANQLVWFKIHLIHPQLGVYYWAPVFSFTPCYISHGTSSKPVICVSSLYQQTPCLPAGGGQLICPVSGFPFYFKVSCNSDLIFPVNCKKKTHFLRYF